MNSLVERSVQILEEKKEQAVAELGQAQVEDEVVVEVRS